VRIRIAEQSDDDAVADLLGQLGYETAIDAARRRVEALIRSEDRMLYLVEIDGSCVGLIEVAVMQAIEHDPRAEIRALVEAAEKWARDRGIAAIRVRSNLKRERTRLFYEKNGYRVTKTSLVFDKQL
jgi:GNAT superfamily N-acetyltransferase